MNTYFETEFGDKIEMKPETEKMLYPNSLKDPMFLEQQLTRNSCANEFFLKKESVEKVGIGSGISNDLYSLGCLLDLLDEINILEKRKFKSCLDIGGAAGIHAAIFRGLYSKKVHVADVYDGRDPLFTYKLLKKLYKFFPYYLIDIFLGINIFSIIFFIKFLEKTY